MSSPFPFLKQVEDILNNYENSLINIPQHQEDHSDDSGQVNSPSSINSDDNIEENNSETVVDENSQNELSSNTSANSILYQSQISTVDNLQIHDGNIEGSQSIFNFSDVEVFRSISNSLTLEIILKLCYSVLSGEILQKDGSLEYVDDISKKLEKWIEDFSTDLSPDYNLVLFNFVDTIKFCLNHYYELIEFINVNYSKDRHENFFVLDKKNNDFLKQLDDNVRNTIELFYLVLRLSIEDLLLSSDFSEFREIKKILEDAKEFEGIYPGITDIITLKSNFLSYKWYKRYIKDISTTGDFKFRIGKQILNSESHIEGDECYKLWNDKIYYHYGFDESIINYTRYAKTSIINETNYANLRFFDIHTLIKYYKDISPSQEKLKSILDYLLKIDTSEKSKYDQYCIEIIKDYAVNNYFSLCSEDKEVSIEKYEKLYYYCCGVLSGSNSNYFLQYKYLNYVLDHIERHIAEESNSDKLTELSGKYFKIIEEKYSKILDEYYQKKNWANGKNNYIFLLTSDESLVKIDLPHCELKSFIVFTSFVLPYNYTEIDLNYSKTRQKFREVKSQLKVIMTLRNDLTKLDNLNKDFDRKESRNMEIIGLFTAIITFVLSSIPAFKFVDNIYQAVLFTLSIASSLGLFILIIFSFTRGAKRAFIEERNWVLFFVVVVLGIITAYSLINFENRSVKGIISAELKNKEEAKIIDSLKNPIGKEFAEDRKEK
ncbi:hypothetical protein GCM10009120_01840 [Sphingobacterium siyangense subsp. cladoniae]|uniref:hypothetical protein n=1 Tax=Sphingobacterium siyangense TaxID=459529 RepID=UPI0031F762BD